MGFGCCCSGRICKNGGTEILSILGSPHAQNYLEILNTVGLGSQASSITGGGGSSAAFAYGIDASNDYVVYAAGDAGIVIQEIGGGAMTTESLGFSSSSRKQDAWDGWFEEATFPITTNTNNGSRYGFESTPFSGAYDVCFISSKEVLVACGVSGVKYFNLETKETKQYSPGDSNIIRNIEKHRAYIITGSAGYTNPSQSPDNDLKSWAFPESDYVTASNKNGGDIKIYTIENEKLTLKTSTSVSGSVNDISSGSKYVYVAYGTITSNDGSSSSGGVSKISITKQNESVTAQVSGVYSGNAVMACQAEGEDIYHVGASESVLYKNSQSIGSNIVYNKTKVCAVSTPDSSVCSGITDYVQRLATFDTWDEVWTYQEVCTSESDSEFEHLPDAETSLAFNWFGGCPMGIAVTKDETDENGTVTKEGKIYVSLWQAGIVVCNKSGSVEKVYNNFSGNNDNLCSSFGSETANWGATMFSGKMACNKEGVYAVDCFQAVANDFGPNFYHPLMKQLFFLQEDWDIFLEQKLIYFLTANGDYGSALLTF